MAHVDALSRPPHCMLIQNSVHLQFLKAQHADDQITTIKTLQETTPHDNYIVKTNFFTKQSTDAAEVINRLENQRHVFGNPARIITDKRSAFTSSAFEDYCKKQNILHISITTGLPRSNGQIENKIPPSLLCCQNFLSTILRNAQFQEQRDALRQDAKKQIYKVQDENRRTYNLRRRQAHKYQLHDLVAIKRTQFGPGLKLKQKYLGPYKVTKVKHNDTYDVEKCDFVDGPSKTSTCAEFMKLWPNQTNST
ncbi:transposon Ty3-I Gag-Pol polyprotein [Trichonephila clavipes]|nr:transposon Ty3-I Gag-Pol polyprotein [Trichonephila clavipes]